MKQVKKVLSFALALILLVTACYTNGLGVSAGVNAAGETEIDVTKVYSGHNDTLITFQLSATDYSTATIAGMNLDPNVDNEAYNFWTNIEIYTGETTFKSLKKAHLESTSDRQQKWYNMWGRSNEISIQLETTTYNDATKIVIPAGTVFPSYAYTNGGSATKGGYVTTQDLEFIKPATISGETTWVKKVDTNVEAIEIADASGKLFFRLSESDYAGKGQTFINQTKLQEYNFLNMIEVYQGETKHALLGEIYTMESYYDLYGRDKVIALDLNNEQGWDGTTITKIVIKAGCQFPSYSYTNGGGKEKIGYVVKADTTFTTTTMAISNATWTRNSAPTEEIATKIDKIQVRGKEARLFVFPTVSDYANAGGNTQISLAKIKDYNLLDYIVVYKSDQESCTLRELCLNDENYYNLWGDTLCIALDMPNDWNGKAVKKIEFKAGCQFPSYAYTHGEGYENVAYTLQEDLVYETTHTSDVVDNVSWTLVDNPTDTTVTGVKSGHNNQIVTFTLSNSDYTGQGNIGDDKTEYNFWSKIKLYTSDTDYVYLGDAHTDQKLFNMWTMPNTVSIQVKKDDGTYGNLTKIEIPAGTVFPSQAYTLGSTQKKGGFKTTEDITFVKPAGAEENPPTGYEWTVDEEPANIETTISKIQVRGDEGENNDYLFVFLNNQDYSAQDYVNSHFDEYDILTKIELSTAEGTKTLEKVMTKEPARYNRYDEKGCITFGLQPGWNGTTIKRITFKQGTEFPAYSYTNGSATSKKAYVLPEDITYTTPVSEWSNEQWHEYYEPVTYPTEITNIHVRDGFVLLFLSQHDYEGVHHTEQIGDKLSAYNLTQNIMITKDGVTKKLSEMPGSEQYYNIWEETGCVAFKMASGYDGTTVTRVAVKKGAEFPAYAYTSTSTKKVTAYVTNKDYVFNTGKQTEADNTVWTKVTPYSSATDITDVSVSGNTLTFTLSENDYVVDAVGSNHTDFDYWNKVKVYTNDTTFDTLGTWADSATATYGSNTLSVTGSGEIVRVVIPAKTVFPSYKYTSGQIGECVGYYVAGEKVFEKQGETWKDVSREVSKVSGDVNGDGIVSSKDIIAMAKYAKNGYGYNASSLTYDKTKTEADNRHIVRRVILGDVLHNYEKESDNLTYFSSSDLGLDSFLNDFYKRQVGYNDYVEGDMTVTSYKPGTTYNGIYNLPWLTKSLLWVDSKNSLESDRTAQLKKQIESVIVDRYGYVWNGDDAVEDPTLGIGKKHGMGWPFPNASHAGGSGDDANVRYWEFNAPDSVSTWSSNTTGASRSNGLYQVTASNKSSVTFTVEDRGAIKSPIIRETSCAPWLTFELRMNDVTNPENIDDIYVKWVNSESDKEYEVKAGDIAAVNYAFTDNYEHVLYLPMYTQTGWDGKYIKEITIEIRAKSGTTFGGTLALNYVRPSFDTRHSNNNANYIEALKEYYNMTGDVDFVKANITKARKAMNFYLQMYDKKQKLNRQSYLYGHSGDKKSLANGLGNGYWDILYTPVYDFQSNMYFYQALKDLSYLEGVLSTNDVSVSDPATIDTATTSGIGSSTYSESASALNTFANDVVGAMRTYFWNEETGRFMAGYDNSNPSNKVDYGYTTWNLQAIELGIADKDQREKIMQWIGKPDSTENGLYHFGFAPRTATENKTGIYGAFIANGGNNTVKDQAFGDSLQFGGAVMYSSYYDLTSRIQVNGADDALTRLTGIQTWYEKVRDNFNTKGTVANDEFYIDYFVSNGTIPQNGAKGYGNGAVGVDGEFTESLLVAAAIPYGFFGMDSEGGDTLCVTPSLPSTMDHWKVENMQYNGVTYDLSIYKDAVRIDSVRGNADGLNVKVTLDCPEGKDIYVDGAKKAATKADGKATVTVDFADATIEVKEEEK